MSNSLTFCKRRIKECNFSVLPNARWSETPFPECFGLSSSIEEAIRKIDETPLRYKLESPRLSKPIKMNITYDPNAEFEYFTHERCLSDGTLLFLWEQQGAILKKILSFGSYNVKKFNGVFVDDVDYEFCYTVGDFVCVCEYSKNFATDERPWLTERFTTFLPIKFDVNI